MAFRAGIIPMTFRSAWIALNFAPLLTAATWTDLTAGFPRTPAIPFELAISPKQPSTLYARAYTTTGCCQLLKSVDGAESWKPVTSVTSVNRFVVDPQDDSLVYVTTNRGVLKSGDAGENWSRANNVSFQQACMKYSEQNC
jgi:hypothetical protein